VNYFGKNPDFDNIVINPILMRKGSTKLAIYGLGNVRDERLNRSWSHKKVTFLRPEEDPDSWFHVFVFHQNRVAHSIKNYIQETMLPDWLNLVIWGHEHECLISPIPTAVGKFRITQPGSSVATSLSEHEARPKHFGLLQIAGTLFKLKPIPLKAVRAFVIDEIVLAQCPELDLLPKNSYADRRCSSPAANMCFD
jgi:double-strand break repair protein MRE11